MDSALRDITERIASCVLRDNLDIRDVIDRLGQVDWNAALDAERARRAQHQEWLDNEVSECHECGTLVKRKDAQVLSGRKYSRDASTHLDGWYCPACYPEKESEFLRCFRRACLICGVFFFVKNEYSARLFCHDHNTAKNKREIYRVMAQNRRTESLGLLSDLTIAQWLEIIGQYNDRCAYCGGPWTDLEHVMPVAAGGGTTASNVVTACRTCNTEKRFRNMQPRVLGIEADNHA